LAAVILLALASPPGSCIAARGYARAHYVLPPDVLENGISFAGESIPLDKKLVVQRIIEQVNFLLMDRRATMMEWFDRMAMYGPIIRRILAREKVPDDMIYVAALVSNFLPNFRSRSGGVGWWSLGSVKEKKSPPVQWVTTNDWDDRRDPVLSTRIASTILSWLHGRKTTNNWLLAICAFLEGTGKVDAAVEKAPGFSYWDTVMPPVSEIVIPRLVALKIIDTHREFYGVDITPPPPAAYDFLDRLKLVKDLPLHVVASWCGTNPRRIWELNPGVDPSTGVLPTPDKRSPSGFPLRVPKNMGAKVRRLLVKKGYLAG
jgi:membrane-bound lytic murein transglycosylase D